MVLEKKIVEIVDARRRMTDFQVITKAHPEHSSGELKINKRPKMGLYRSPDIHWCHGKEYGLEDLVKKLDTSVLTSLYYSMT